MRGEAQDAQTKFAAGFDVGFEFTFAKYDSLADGNFSAGADEGFPLVVRERANEKDFDGRLEEFVASWIIFTRRTCVQAGAAAEEARGQDSRVVDDDEFVATEQIGEFAELAVVPRAGGAVEQEHARGVACGEWALGDSLGW